MRKKTKIVATIGPASRDRTTIAELIKNGMNVARLNFSHGTLAEHRAVIENVRSIAQASQTIGILQDIAGPKIRIGEIAREKIILTKGESFTLTEKTIMGTKEKVSVDLPHFSNYVKPGDHILINDGLVELIVLSYSKDEVNCLVENGGLVSSRKGISLPGSADNIELLSEKDIRDIEFGIKMGVDFLAISFVRNRYDLLQIKDILKKHNTKIPLIAKIEKPEALKNFNEILEEADGIMIARGDLGVEVPFEQVPIIQKKLIRKANRACKPVITATQMLASMVDNLRPTRAEVTDVANAILDGTDAVMLSEETAVGNNPVQAVHTMTKVAAEVEKNLNRTYDLNSLKLSESYSPDLNVAENACRLAYGTEAKAIVCFTMSGSTARKVARFRPRIPVLAITQSDQTCRELSLSWGINPIVRKGIDNLDEVIKASQEELLLSNLAKYNDHFIITAGLPLNESGNTNLTGVFKIK